MISNYLQATADSPERAYGSKDPETELPEGVEYDKIADTTSCLPLDISEMNSADTYQHTVTERGVESVTMAYAEGDVSFDVRKVFERSVHSWHSDNRFV